MGAAIVLLGAALAAAGVRNDDVLVLALGALASLPGLFLAARQWGANRRASQFLRELTELPRRSQGGREARGRRTKASSRARYVAAAAVQALPYARHGPSRPHLEPAGVTPLE